MNRKIYQRASLIVAVLVGLVGAVFVWGCSEAETDKTSPSQVSQQFIMAGSGSNLPITGKLIQAFRDFDEVEKEKTNEEQIEMPSSIGSGGAIKAVNEGAITLGLVSRPLTDKEIGMGLKQEPYARVGIVFGANKTVPDETITSQDLVDIFLGKKTKWKSGDMIIVLSREKGDSTNQVLEKQIPGFKAALADSFEQKRWQIYYTDQEEAHSIVTVPFSMGFTDTAALAVKRLPIKPLMLDGVKPDIQNISNGQYPLYKDLYFVYKEPVSERAKRFLQFVKSDEGAKIILSNGGIPLKGK